MIKGIRELAKHLDLSISTVSKALNGRFDINAETRARVLKAAADLGYVANQSGRALRDGATHTVGFMITQGLAINGDSFFLEVFEGVQQVLRQHRLDLVVLPCSSDEPEAEYLARIVTRGMVDAMILSGLKPRDSRIAHLQTAGIPFVTLGQSGLEHASVEFDFESVANTSVHHLARAGHRRIAVSLPADNLNLGRLFLAGYERGLTEAGLSIDPDLVMRTPPTVEGGSGLCGHLLSLPDRPTAVILSNEMSALGLYPALRAQGLEPGKDLAIIGFRDSAATRHLRPSLTCFSTSLTDVGRELARIILAQTGHLEDEAQELCRLWPMTMLRGESG